jgi:cupin fold WbuC family metalloprotein
MNTRSESAEVLYADEPTIVVGGLDLAELKRRAAASPRGRARLCAHRSPEDGLHEMLIVLGLNAYVRPHRHTGKTESFLVLEGNADVILFGEDGRVDRTIPMGPPNSGRSFYYRLSQPVYHTLVVRSDWFIFLEVTPGPFRRDETLFPCWAPDGADVESALKFIRGLP